MRARAGDLQLVRSRPGDDWTALSTRLDIPAILLRLYNPFITEGRLSRATQLVAYPDDPPEDLFTIGSDGQVAYRARLGDNYMNLAFAFGVDVDRLRSANQLWHLQLLPPDMMLTIPVGSTAAFTGAPEQSDAMDHVVRAAARPAAAPTPPVPRYLMHRVGRGENLTMLARRYGTSVSEIQRLNALGRRTAIRIGERLKVPAR